MTFNPGLRSRTRFCPGYHISGLQPGAKELWIIKMAPGGQGYGAAIGAEYTAPAALKVVLGTAFYRYGAPLELGSRAVGAKVWLALIPALSPGEKGTESPPVWRVEDGCGRCTDWAAVVPALQAGVVFWRWLPGPPLVGLASTQAVKLRAFSPKTGLLLRAESPKFDSPG
jgi:hypothetical protein